MLIVLVGMPASGKSTLGQEIARKLNFKFIDLDHLICEREQCDIPEIFRTQGESYFRQAERNALISVLSLTDLVLATGGGAPCFFDNMDLINQSALSLFLETPIATIAERIRADRDNIRPLYAQKSHQELIDYLDELYKKRQFFYQKAHLILK